MFAKFNKDKALSQKILLDNLFITDYLPYAPDISVKVYLLGLAVAGGAGENTIEAIALKLGITEDEVLSSFKYWEDQGLITILSISPPQIEFKEIKPLSEQIKIFKKTKFKTFNNQLHAMLQGRTILPAEYHEYYYAIEHLHFEQEAMLTVIAYCVRLKGENIGYPYIMSVARSLAAEGALTYERVNERLSELDLFGAEIKSVLKALSLKRSADMADKKLWIKWTKSLGFSSETIIKVAKAQKKGGMEKLDSTLIRYYENQMLTWDEIESYNQNREMLMSLTAQIVRILGRYFDRLDYIIEIYTQKWLSYGFENEALITIADECFKRNKRNLEDMDALVSDYYTKGLLTTSALSGHKEQQSATDTVIKGILKAAKMDRSVTSWDRDYYRTWTHSWNMPLDVIEYAATLSVGKGIPYLNAILAGYNNKGITDLAGAKACTYVPSVTSTVAATVTKKSVEELNALFTVTAPEDI